MRDKRDYPPTDERVVSGSVVGFEGVGQFTELCM